MPGRLVSVCVLVLLSSACGSEVGTPPDPPIGGGPVPPGTVGAVGSFTVAPLAEGAVGPVVAVSFDGSLHAGWIDAATAWPVFAAAGEGPVPLPGEPAPARTLAMAASLDGAVHLVWDGGGAIHYTHWHAGAFATPQILDAPEVGAREPTIAVAPAGDVVVAYTVDVTPPDVFPTEPALIRARRGRVSAGGDVVFAPAVVANPGCCTWGAAPGGPTSVRVSGPTLVVAGDDSIHIIYEWTTSYDTVLEYTHDRGGAFSAPVGIEHAAYVPCPSLAVDGDVAHVTYLLDDTRYVWYTTITGGVVAPKQSIYTAIDYATMAMMVRDASGALHVGVTEIGAAASRLVYLRAADGTMLTPPVVAASIESPAYLDLTPVSGGVVISPQGDLRFSFLSRGPLGDGAGTAQVATGR